ncbi:MAG: DUF1513 domain-containing protein [Rhodospirillales bacterium]
MATSGARFARRALLGRSALLLGLAGSGALSGRSLRAASRETAFVTCCQLADGDFAAVLLDRSGESLLTERLEARGHEAVLSPDGRRAVVFARRPGSFALVLDLAAQRRIATFAPPAGRHFYGHGFYAADGRLLYATENDFEGERGLLGIYDAQDGYRALGAIESGAIGPHQAILLRDGRTVAVANGGIATHPDYPRQKLNLATMSPCVALIDLTSGAVIERARLPRTYHRLSLRHLAEAGDGSLWVGGQYEGPGSDSLPLVARYRRNLGLEPIAAPAALYRGMNHYVGSVVASRDGSQIATTSPRGGQVVIWDSVTARPLEVRRIADVCGAAPATTGFTLSDGEGRLWQSGETIATAFAAFDNHLTRATGVGLALTRRYQAV